MALKTKKYEIKKENKRLNKGGEAKDGFPLLWDRGAVEMTPVKQGFTGQA